MQGLCYLMESKSIDANEDNDSHLQFDPEKESKPLPARYHPETMDTETVHWSYTMFSSLILLADLFIRIGLSIRVIMRKRPYGVSIAWLLVVLIIPFLGGFVYLLIGENRIPERRIERAKASYHTYQKWLQTLKARSSLSLQADTEKFAPLHRQAESLVGLPAMTGNSLELITCPEDPLFHHQGDPKGQLHLPSAILYLGRRWSRRSADRGSARGHSKRSHLPVTTRRYRQPQIFEK